MRVYLVTSSQTANGRLAGYWSVAEADGAVWRETFDWYDNVFVILVWRIFGDSTCVGTLFRASQFLSEELPIRLAHRVQELEHLPDGLNEMPSIERVRDWYAQSFEVLSAICSTSACRS